MKKRNRNIATTLLLGFLCLNIVIGQAQIDSLQIVDYHVHIFSSELISNLTAREFDFERSGFQAIKEPNKYADVSEISKDNGYAKMILISTGYAYENLDGKLLERKFVQKENNLLADLVKTNPDKLIGFYGIDPLKDYAIEEIKRCDEELELEGIKLHLQSSNLNLKDSIQLTKLKEVFQLADQRKIPLLIHNNAWDKSIGKEYFEIFKREFLDDCESLTIIFAHGGGGGGFFQFGYDFLESFSEYFQKDESSNKHEIYFELSGVVKLRKFPGSKTNAELTEIMEVIGFDKFLFGSDYPVRNTPTYFNEVSKLLDIPFDEFKKIVERDIFKN